jgi:hypothetical protein
LTDAPSDEQSGERASDPKNWAEEEVAGEHGSTVFPGSLEEEKRGDIDPQTPGGFVEKVKEEAAEGEGAGGKVKRVAQELDRAFSGEYERRDEEQAQAE